MIILQNHQEQLNGNKSNKNKILEIERLSEYRQIAGFLRDFLNNIKYYLSVKTDKFIVSILKKSEAIFRF